MRRLAPVLASLALAACAASSPSGLPPLPSDTRMASPGADVPRDRAAFAGHWKGQWDGKHDTALVVEEIRGTEAQVLVGWAIATPLGLESPGYARDRGQFTGDTLQVRSPRFVPPVILTYKMNPDGTLDARYERGSATSRATLTRVPR